MPRGTSRIFREKVSSAASALGISGGVDFRRAGAVFIDKARDAYADLGFGVGAAGRSARAFRQAVELANAELGISAFAAQTQSLNWAAASTTDALRDATGQALGISTVWSLGVWYKPTTVPNSGTVVDIRTPAPDTQSLIRLYHDLSLDRLRFDWGDDTGAPVEITAFNNFYTGQQGLWVHILAVWTGAILLMFRNGVSVGAPDVGVNNPAITMADDLRRVAVGNISTGGNSSPVGNIAQAGLWRVDITALATNGVPAFLQSGPSSIDLNVDDGANDYLFAGDLAHWWRPGHEGSPNLGKDYSLAGFTPTIDLGTNLVGLTDGDRQADVP